MKHLGFLAVLALATTAGAQTNYQLKPVRLSYTQALDYNLGLDLPWRVTAEDGHWPKSRPVFEFRFNDHYDPFRTWRGQRVGYRESFGSMFRSGRTSVEFSTGSTSAGRMSTVGFEIRW
jgi:hypothetical protein